jgi:uncharacterized protein with NAD-binding domain and iron-sulfur cluster
MAERRRVLVIGAGIAGLTVAHELTRTPAARARFDVELVEMGHRVGGRLASAHRPEAWDRNEEHGLHVWFGWYDNTFRLAEEVWRDWRRPPDCPWRDVHDGLRPIWTSEHGFEGPDGFELRRIHLPRNADRPGDATHRSAIGRVSTWVDLARALAHTWAGLVEGSLDPNPRAATLWPDPRSPALVRTLDPLVRSFLARFEAVSRPRDPAVRVVLGAALERLIARVHRPLVRRATVRAADNPGALALAHTLDLLLAMIRGVCSPEHRLLEDGDLDRVCEWEFSAWFAHHGADPQTIANSRLLECLYDIPFGYRGGDRERRVLEASTALRFSYRMVAGYKHALAFLLEAGAGETLVAPLFELVRERGARHRPFHRLVRLELDAAGRHVERLIFVRAARVRAGYDRYDPLVTRGGLRGFRADPDWAQLIDGEQLAARGVDFYSRFGDRGEQTEVTLERGRDFDDVVLALPLGSVMPDGDGHSPVQAWLDAHPPARACLAKLHLVPTVAAQLWFEQSSDQLGLRERAAVTWARPYSVVCNMSPVIERERWPPPGPGACIYLCGAWPLRSPNASSSDAEALTDDLRSARAALKNQLDAHLDSLCDPAARLYAPPGVDPWTVQYVRANVEPWDLADLALPGADAVRLDAAQTGLDNLALAGAWVRTAVNSTSVEAAVSSGLAAARALGAEVRPILAEHLFRRPSRHAWLPGRAPERSCDAHGSVSPKPQPSAGRRRPATRVTP